MGRGRPPKLVIEELPRKFVRTFKYKDGSYSEWHYNLDKNPNGPLKVEIFYPDTYIEETNEKEKKKTRKSRS